MNARRESREFPGCLPSGRNSGISQPFDRSFESRAIANLLADCAGFSTPVKYDPDGNDPLHNGGRPALLSGNAAPRRSISGYHLWSMKRDRDYNPQSNRPATEAPRLSSTGFI